MFLVHRVQQVILVLKVHRVRKDHRDHKVQQVILVLKVHKDHKVSLVHKDQLATLVLKVLKVLLECQMFLVRKVRRVQQV
jgi:hypothetical protein